MLPAAAEAALSRTVACSRRYLAESSVDSTALFEDALIVLIRSLNVVDPTARLSPSIQHVSDLLSDSFAILSSPTTSASTRSKLNRLLFNISFYNVRLRKFMADDLQLCGPIFECLKRSLKEQLGPQNMIDILRLLQTISYEKSLTLGAWTNELISFLMAEINREPEPEWMPYCIAILCNLASRSKSVCSRIRKSSIYRPFCKKVVKLLAHDSRIVVVSALVLVGYLEERIRDMVYCQDNVHETFRCVFNVVIMGDGDCLMTRQIACDLLRRLVVSESPTVSAVPVVTATAKDVSKYEFFVSSIQGTAQLLVVLDPRLEESTKIYDLLLAFCGLPELRSDVCSAILACAPSENRLTTPALAILNTASLTSEEAIDPSVPIRAIKLLTHLCKRIIDTNDGISRYFPATNLMLIIEKSLKTSVDTGREEAASQCQLIDEGINLAEVVSHDDELRNRLIAISTTNLCNHISEFQLMTNPVVVHMAKPPSQRGEPLPDWSLPGVAVVLQLIRLLAALKDHSKEHKYQYWNSLKDERLVPFLAYAIAYGDHTMVHDALLLYTHCAQVQEFKSRWLGDLVASCAIAKRIQLEAVLNNTLNTSRDLARRPSPDITSDTMPFMSSPEVVPSSETSKAVDDLLQRLRNGLNVKDVKMSEVLAVYDRKIQMMEARERELEKAVAISEKLRSQPRSYPNDGDMGRMRSVVVECEKWKEKHDSLLREIAEQQRVAEEKVSQLTHQISSIMREKEVLEKDREQDRKLVLKAREHAEEQIKRFNAAVVALQQEKAQTETVRKELAEEQRKHSQFINDVEYMKQEHRVERNKLMKDNEVLLAEVDATKVKLQKAQQDIEKSKRIREAMLKLAEGSDL